MALSLLLIYIGVKHVLYSAIQLFINLRGNMAVKSVWKEIDLTESGYLSRYIIIIDL